MVKVRRLPKLSGLLAVSLLAAAVPAVAHHSAAPFDMTRKVTVSGIVERWVWSNPHSWLYLRVAQPGGKQVIWGFEAGSAGMMARQGWAARDMKPGDRVTVTASPARDGKPVGLIDKVKLASGRVLGGGFGPPPPGAPGGPPPGPGGY